MAVFLFPPRSVKTLPLSLIRFLLTPSISSSLSPFPAMADQENCTRLTRAAAKKRAASAAVLQSLEEQAQPTRKKRVVLGELPNHSNVAQELAVDVDAAKRKLRPAKKERKPAPDVEANADDPQMCAPYAKDIYEYLRSMEIESKRRPLPDFIEAVQKDVTATMRAILVDWLVEVAEEYKLVSDTLYLTISYVDRFLSLNALSRQRLQLLGVSCMLIASKYEEISPPHVEDFCYITDNTYTKEEVVNMESEVLRFLKFEMGSPTIKTFLRRYMMAAQERCKLTDLKLEFLGNFLAELSLLDYICVRFLPSVIAASVVFLSRLTIHPKIHPWTSALQHCSGYKPADLKECIQAIHELQVNKRWGALKAIRDKYNQHKFKCVPLLSPPTNIPPAYFEAIKE